MDAQAGLRLCCSQTPKTGFLASSIDSAKFEHLILKYCTVLTAEMLAPTFEISVCTCLLACMHCYVNSMFMVKKQGCAHISI